MSGEGRERCVQEKYGPIDVNDSRRRGKRIESPEQKPELVRRSGLDESRFELMALNRQANAQGPSTTGVSLSFCCLDIALTYVNRYIGMPMADL